MGHFYCGQLCGRAGADSARDGERRSRNGCDDSGAARMQCPWRKPLTDRGGSGRFKEGRWIRSCEFGSIRCAVRGFLSVRQWRGGEKKNDTRGLSEGGLV